MINYKQLTWEFNNLLTNIKLYHKILYCILLLFYQKLRKLSF